MGVPLDIYANFRNKTNTGLMHLMDAIEPTRTLWDCLKYLKEHHELVIEQIRSTFPEELIRDKVDKLHELMSSALDVRCHIILKGSSLRVKGSSLRFV